MRSDVKIQNKSLKEMKEDFILLKMDFFTIFERTLPLFMRVFPSFTVSTEGYLETPPHKKWEFFWTLVDGWNFLTIVAESWTLDVVEVLDMPLVSENYVCD